MDVIALHQAGFGGAVAPLGTALTEEQLEELWRLSPAPVLCFDGDAAGAGRRRGRRRLALPLLAPDRSLRLATLPAGEDPDTLVRRRGAERHSMPSWMRPAPLAEALFDLLREGPARTTPEHAPHSATRLEAAARTHPGPGARARISPRAARPVLCRAAAAAGSAIAAFAARPPPAADFAR